MTLRTPVLVEAADSVGAVHFIAIGGSGMSGIASAYAALGVPVSGSDQIDSAALAHLREQGVTTYVGHDPSQVGDAATVVVSSAIKENNVELVEARRRGLRVWHRSAALAGLMVGRRGIAITGTHGKTTTTGMCATLLVAAGADPSYVIGSPLATTGESSHLGGGEAFVIEADESDGSFLQYPASIVVVTNIEADHLDNWGTPERYRDGFERVCRQDGVSLVVACADDPGSAALARSLRADGRTVVTYGFSDGADVRLSQVEVTPERTTAQLAADGDEGPFVVTVPGTFNLLNAAAAYAVGRALGLAGDQLRAAAAEFQGTYRRFQLVGVARGVRIFDDYAHHPTELVATLRAARDRVGEGRLVACFQPHLFSRTVEFADEIAAALTSADLIVCCGIYPAREDAADFPGVTGQLVADAVSARGRDVVYVPELADVAPALEALVQPSDLLLTLGAGDVTFVGPALKALLEGAS